MEKLQAKVTVGEQLFRFEVQLHFSNRQQDLKMDPIEFYEKWSPKHIIPVGDHYEIQILQIPALPEHVKLHIYPVQDDQFVCWTEQISNLERVKDVFKIWCLGSVYTILTTKDFGAYFFSKEIAASIEKFENSLSEEFGMKFELE